MTISGAHVLLYTKDPAADRAFFRDVLQFPSVDAGQGWLIFKLPPAEVAVHPADGEPFTELYLMCDDLQSTIESLAARHVTCTPVEKERWGVRTSIRLPGGGRIGLYQPMHPTALKL
ncbi:MAG TPA: hypothetical protein VMI94_20575 [Bryobacteraceae bacterium]|nr:hypothetical protein [Bryobacteraceae bacterium]